MNNLTFKLFVSSTFSDFKEERQLLDEKIFPEIKKYCLSFGYDFQLVDLRWGIYTEATLNHKTLPICIEEVKRCKKFAPAPNFLAMIGERYGWVPLPPYISKNEFLQIFNMLDEEDKETLLEWYILDENEIDEQYYLKTRSGRFINDNIWNIIEENLKTILLKGANLAGLTEQNLIKYQASATEHEIIHGILEDKNISNNAIVIFRNGHEQKDEDTQKITNLRNKIRYTMEKANTINNLIYLDYSEDYKKIFTDTLINRLKNNISDEISRLNSQKRNIRTSERFLKYYNENSIYYGNSKTFDDIFNYINSNNRRVLFVTGESGSGKTTILAKVLFTLKNDYTAIFFGENEKCDTLFSSLSYIVDDLCKKYKITIKEPLTHSNLSKSFYDILYNIPDEVYNYETGTIEEQKKHIIIIDGIDMFPDTMNLTYNFLPILLPKSVKIIISSGTSQITEKFARPLDKQICLNKLTDKEFICCYFAHLARHHRCLKDLNQLNTIMPVLEKGGFPLQAKLLANISSKWNSGKVINTIPTISFDTALEFIHQIDSNGSHNKETVLYTLALIAISPIGITEPEILFLLYTFDSVRMNFEKELKHTYTANRLPLMIWSRLFFDLKDCLDISYINGSAVVKFSHNIFKKVIIESFPEYCKTAKEHLIEYATQNQYSDIRLARTVLHILNAENRIIDLATLLTTDKFLDFCIKKGELSYIIEILSNIVGSKILKGALLSKAIETLYYLNKYRHILKYYHNEYAMCAYNEGLISYPHATFSEIHDNSEALNKKLNFPYNIFSSIVLSKNQKLCAIYSQNYVYICNFENMIELSSIYIEPDEEITDDILKLETSIKEVHWLDEYIIAIFSNLNKLFIYDIRNRLPRLLHTLSISNINTCIRYCKEQNTIIYCTDSKISCVNFSNLDEKFYINTTGRVYFNDESEEITVFDDKSLTLLFFNIEDGTLINQKKIKKKDYKNSNSKKSILRQVNKNILFSAEVVFNNLSNTYDMFWIYDCKASKSKYIIPPLSNKILQLIVGKRTVIFLYEQYIISFDLIDSTTKIFPISGVATISWIHEDNSILLITLDQKIKHLHLSDFSETDKLLLCKENLLILSFKNTEKIFLEYDNMLKNARISPELLTYDAFFSNIVKKIYVSKDFLSQKAIQNILPTYICKSKTDIIAKCYERLNLISLEKGNGNILCLIDNLHLGVSNNILKIAFSDSSIFFMIWTNLFVEVFSIKKATRILSKPLHKSPAAFVSFISDSELKIISINGIANTYSLNDKKAILVNTVQEIEEYTKSKKEKYFTTPYYFNPFSTVLNRYNIFHSDFLDSYFSIDLHKHLNNINRYFGEKHWLLYKEGVFYLNGKKTFENNNFFDFELSLTDTRMHYNSQLEFYLAEKNNILSPIYELNDEGYIILVCFAMNSVILFDVRNLKIVSAYKTKEKIIGSFFKTESKELTLYVDLPPSTITLKINLP